MHKDSHLNPISNNKGVALVTVLLVMLVLTILTTGVIAISMSNYNQSSTTVDHKQAYYVAEAGVNYQVKMFEATVNTLIAANKNSAEINEGINTWVAAAANVEQTLGTVSGVTRTFTATASRTGNDITISSTGNVGTVTRTLTKKIAISGFLIDKAILTSGTLNINKTDVFNGPIQTLSNIDNTVLIDKLGKVSEVSIPTPVPPKTFEDVIDGCTAVGPISDMTCQTGAYTYEVIYDDSITSLPAVIVPTTPAISKTNDKLAVYKISGKSNMVSSTGAIVISSSTATASTYNLAALNNSKTTFYSPSISITGTVANFAIDIGNKDIQIVTDKLNLKGSFKITGTGTLTIFVTNANFVYSCGNKVVCGVKGNNKTEVADQFIVVITGTSGQTVNLSTNGGATYMSLITNINLNLNMGGNGSFNGFFATSGTSISLGGTAGSNALVYAPNAIIDIGGNATITGSLIGKSFRNVNSNATKVTYNPDFSGPPFDFLSPFSNISYNSTVEN